MTTALPTTLTAITESITSLYHELCILWTTLLMALSTHWKSFMIVLSDQWNDVMIKLSPLWNSVMLALNTHWQAFVIKLGPHWESFTTKCIAIYHTVTTVLENITDTFHWSRVVWDDDTPMVLRVTSGEATIKFIILPLIVCTIIAFGLAAYIVYQVVHVLVHYRTSLKNRVEKLESNLKRGLVYRATTTKTKNDDNNDNEEGMESQTKHKIIKCLELNPQFVEHCQSQKERKFQLVSLGQYLSSLRPIFSENEDDDEEEEKESTKERSKRSAFGISRLIARELEATMGRVLLQQFGPTIGPIVLPLLGINNVKSRIATVASSIATWWLSHMLVNVAEAADPTKDVGVIPFNVQELVGLINLNQKAFGTETMKEQQRKQQAKEKTSTSLQYLQSGEIGYDPSFSPPVFTSQKMEEENDETKTKSSNDSNLICNPFIISKHWNKAIKDMEDLIRKQCTESEDDKHSALGVTATSPTPNTTVEPKPYTTKPYNPNDRSLPDPTPINQRLLPDLYFGWGDAKCTHTKREILQNRLFSILLNKLSYNYYLQEQQEKSEGDYFCVQMGPTSTKCYYPGDFVQALIDTGHTVDVVPTQSITTFGIAACIKEQDNTWSNIPIAFFFETGYEREDGRPAYFTAPHGGLDLTLRGPILNNSDEEASDSDKNTTNRDKRCSIQFYIAIEGLCGWHSNHNAEVPWIEPVAASKVYNRKEALQAVRMAGLLAVTFNAIGTEMSLPFGGYGVMGVCNDTGALLDVATRGQTNMFPLTSTGRFLMHITQRLQKLQNALSQSTGISQESVRDQQFRTATTQGDLNRLMAAARTIDSDLHASPSNLPKATNRFLNSNPKVSHFEVTVESKEILTSLTKTYEHYVSTTNIQDNEYSSRTMKDVEQEQRDKKKDLNFFDLFFQTK